MSFIKILDGQRYSHLVVLIQLQKIGEMPTLTIPLAHRNLMSFLAIH